MRAELREVHQLKRLLATSRLTMSDRKAIEARIQELLSSRAPEKAKSERLSPYLLGTFDRPAPPLPRHSVADPRVPTPQPHNPNLPAVPSQPLTNGEEGEPATNERPLTPEEIEAKSKLIANIADRIMLLRAVWATTLSREVACETEAWLKKLQDIAAEMPHEMAERALGPHVSFLTQPVQTISKPQISERLQERLLPPSMPSGRHSEVLSEFYWSRLSPEQPRQPEHPPGYVPDGLQSWIS